MIKTVVLTGLGGVGSVYASKMPGVKVLVDGERLKTYTDNPTVINNELYKFDYVTKCPDAADLIIISAKFYSLGEVLNRICVKPGTIIISLMNGISSEDIISRKFPEATVVPCYLICNSIVRNGRNIYHDGVNKIVMGHNSTLEEFFNQCNINYEVSADIQSSMWQKFMLNIVANQLSAVTGMSFGEMNALPYIESLLRKILDEVIKIAHKENVLNPEKLADNAIETFRNMAPYGKTSMLQDIENARRTEIEAFAGTVIELGKKHNIPTPYNDVFNYLISGKSTV